MSRIQRARFHALAAAAFLTACGTGCGLRLSGFLIPLYRAPSGYSETYHDHLEAADSQPIRKELVDPSLATIHDWMQPVPMAVSGTEGTTSGSGAMQGLMPDGSMPGSPQPVPDFGNSQPGEIPDLLPGTPPGSVFPKLQPDTGGAGVPPAPSK